MHEHDQEMIMALVEGTLDDSSAATAAAEIAACDECSSDLEMQRFALAAVADAPDVYLTATESATLHTNLRLELKVEMPAPSRPKRSFAWGKWVPAVGIAAVFVAAVALLPGVMGGSDDESADMTMAATETTAAAAETTEAFAQAPAAGNSEDRLDDSLAGTDAEEMAATATTESMAETTTTMAAPETTSSDLTGVIDGLEYLGPIEDLDTTLFREQIAADIVPLSFVSDTAKSFDPDFAACAAEKSTPELADTLGIPEGSAPLLLGVVSDANGEEFVLVAYVPDDVQETVFVTLRIAVCELVEVLP